MRALGALGCLGRRKDVPIEENAVSSLLQVPHARRRISDSFHVDLHSKSANSSFRCFRPRRHEAHPLRRRRSRTSLRTRFSKS